MNKGSFWIKLIYNLWHRIKNRIGVDLISVFVLTFNFMYLEADGHTAAARQWPKAWFTNFRATYVGKCKFIYLGPNFIAGYSMQ